MHQAISKFILPSQLARYASSHFDVYPPFPSLPNIKIKACHITIQCICSLKAFKAYLMMKNFNVFKELRVQTFCALTKNIASLNVYKMLEVVVDIISTFLTMPITTVWNFKSITWTFKC